MSPDDNTKPGFVEHLEELRLRIIHSLIIFFIFTTISYLNFDFFMKIITSGITTKLVFIYPAEAFIVRLKIACYIGCLLSLPFLIYHIWRFFTPALYSNEQKILIILPISYLLFILGSIVSVGLVIPKGIKILLSLGGNYMEPYISADAYVSFIFYIVLSFGLVFQIPLVIVLLVMTNIVQLKQLYVLRPYVLVGAFIVAAILTPGPDIFSQIVLATISYLFYELSVLFCSLLK